MVPRPSAMEVIYRRNSNTYGRNNNNNNNNNNATAICSSQEVYIESLGLPYYALDAWTHSSFIIGSPLLENYDPCPYKCHQRYEEAHSYKRRQRCE
eukprot:jgi/Psemu1/7784/gm1.7784_g